MTTRNIAEAVTHFLDSCTLENAILVRSCKKRRLLIELIFNLIYLNESNERVTSQWVKKIYLLELSC